MKVVENEENIGYLGLNSAGDVKTEDFVRILGFNEKLNAYFYLTILIKILKREVFLLGRVIVELN